jgi:hypothetical protein
LWNIGGGADQEAKRSDTAGQARFVERLVDVAAQSASARSHGRECILLSEPFRHPTTWFIFNAPYEWGLEASYSTLRLAGLKHELDFLRGRLPHDEDDNTGT